MSRIGKKPVIIPNGVSVEIKDSEVLMKGPKGEIKRALHPKVKLELVDNTVIVSLREDTKETHSLHGLWRTLVSNMVEGVSKGYEKQLEIIGVGFRAQASGNKINLTLGFSHPVEYKAPQGITFEMDQEKKNIITIKGNDKEIVGQVAAIVRSFKPPEPYKGKGIKYMDEHIVRKAGKTAGAK